jgi:hypothetical protein
VPIPPHTPAFVCGVIGRSWRPGPETPRGSLHSGLHVCGVVPSCILYKLPCLFLHIPLYELIIVSLSFFLFSLDLDRIMNTQFPRGSHNAETLRDGKGRCAWRTHRKRTCSIVQFI